MAKPLDYKELIFQKGGLLVVQIKKGFYQLRHHSGAVLYFNCFRSMDEAMKGFDAVFPLYDWTLPYSHFVELMDKEDNRLRDAVFEKLDPLETVKQPKEN